MLKLAIGADHGGVGYKTLIRELIAAEYPDVQLVDVGTDSADSVDYPDFAQAVVDKIISGDADRGILVCGTGIGMSIKANRHPEIRASVVGDVFSAEMTRAHNDSNVLCLGERVLEVDLMKQIVRLWIETEFEGGRHQRRVDKLG